MQSDLDDCNKENNTMVVKNWSSNLVVPVLVCEKFQEPLWLGFGCIEVDAISRRPFRLANPLNVPAEVSIISIPINMGLVLKIGDAEVQKALIAPYGTINCEVFWKPRSHISMREAISIHCEGVGKIYVNLHGVAGRGCEVTKCVNSVQFNLRLHAE